MPDEGVVIAVQADTGSSISNRGYFRALDALTDAVDAFAEHSRVGPEAIIRSAHPA